MGEQPARRIGVVAESRRERRVVFAHDAGAVTREGVPMEVVLGETEEEDLARLERPIEILGRVSINLGNRDFERRVAEPPKQ